MHVLYFASIAWMAIAIGSGFISHDPTVNTMLYVITSAILYSAAKIVEAINTKK